MRHLLSYLNCANDLHSFSMTCKKVRQSLTVAELGCILKGIVERNLQNNLVRFGFKSIKEFNCFLLKFGKTNIIN